MTWRRGYGESGGGGGGANATTLAGTTPTAFGLDLLDAGNAADGRETLGVGTISTQDANAVAITGGTVSGVTLDTTSSISTASATGWTLTNGSGTASIASGDLVLVLGASTVPGAYASVPRGSYSHGRGLHDLVVQARLAELTNGDSANVYFAIGLRKLSDGTGWFANIRGNGGYLDLWDGSDRGGATGYNRAALAAGTLWVRLALAGPTAALYVGVGSGANEPAADAWDFAAQYATGFDTDCLSNVVFTLDAVGGGSPDQVTVKWDSITVCRLGDL